MGIIVGVPLGESLLGLTVGLDVGLPVGTVVSVHVCPMCLLVSQEQPAVHLYPSLHAQRQSVGLFAAGSLMQIPPGFVSQPCMSQCVGSVHSHGCTVGAAVGLVVGIRVGVLDGTDVGTFVGLTDGLPVGVVVSVHVWPVCLSSSQEQPAVHLYPSLHMQRQSEGSLAVGSFTQMPPGLVSQPCM